MTTLILNTVKALAVDIGGANLKIADGEGFSGSHHFPLWKEPARLAEKLAELLAKSPHADILAVTMTGELADCFATKAEGVNAILDAVEQAASGREILVYLCDGRLVPARTARAEALLAGASNWHVLAGYVSRFCRGETGLLIDIGSTTTDIIPVGLAEPEAIGRTDPERLAAGELVYTGVERSPICALVRKLTWRGEPCPVAQEVFATTLDAYLLLGDLSEESEDFETADGRSRTKKNAHGRMARAICADATMFSRTDSHLAAETIREAQLQQLMVAAKQVLGRMKSSPETIVISGQGEFLARQLIERIGDETSANVSVVSLAEKLGPEISRSACAHALATRVRERAGV